MAMETGFRSLEKANASMSTLRASVLLAEAGFRSLEKASGSVSTLPPPVLAEAVAQATGIATLVVACHHHYLMNLPSLHLAKHQLCL